MVDTSISWTHRPGTRGRSWNPTQGCALLSEGCRNCYAMRMARRFAGPGGWAEGLVNLKTGKWTGEARLAERKLTEPLTWREPSTVFVDSMSDLFYEGYKDEEIAAVFGVMAACPQHTFIILTKRPARMRTWFIWADQERGSTSIDMFMQLCATAAGARIPRHEIKGTFKAYPWPLPNVWLGASVENQDELHRVEDLAATPAVIRLLSCEPLLGRLELGLLGTLPSSVTGSAYVMTWERIHWVIAGCESGPRARPCNEEWLRALRDECAIAAVTFFCKQAVEGGAITVGPGSRRKGAGIFARSGAPAVVELPYLDGVQHANFPVTHQEAA